MEMQIMLTFKEFIVEGNPLARLNATKGEGRAFSVISAEREGLPKAENERRTAELKKKLTAQGYGHRRAIGHWEGGKENSLLVQAKNTGTKSAGKLRYDMNRHGKTYGQDSVLHHDASGARVEGTNKTGDPGFRKTQKLGRVAYNRPDAPFQTELRPSKRKANARFTTTKD